MHKKTRFEIVKDYFAENGGEGNPLELAGLRGWDYSKTVDYFEKLCQRGFCTLDENGTYRMAEHAPGNEHMPADGKNKFEVVVNYIFVQGTEYRASREDFSNLGLTDFEINLGIMADVFTMCKDGGYSLTPRIWAQRGIRFEPYDRNSKDGFQQDGYKRKKKPPVARRVSSKIRKEADAYMTRLLEKNGTAFALSVGELIRAVGRPTFDHYKKEGIIRIDSAGTCKFTKEAVERKIEGLEF